MERNLQTWKIIPTWAKHISFILLYFFASFAEAFQFDIMFFVVVANFAAIKQWNM